MRTLIFYTTSGCHLCEQAKLLLDELDKTLGLEIEEVDISSEDALVSLYGIRIPVVKSKDSGVEIGWPFTREELKNL